MAVKFPGRARAVPAGAGAEAPFLVHLAVIPPAVLGLEGPKQVVGNRLVSEFREATRATRGSHVSLLPPSWKLFRVGARKSFHNQKSFP
jgi:hypothetical protein